MNIINLNAIYILEDYGYDTLPAHIIEDHLKKEILDSFAASEVIAIHVDVLEANATLHAKEDKQ